jgi:UDP-N-acetylmuramoyl-tripeptide--D-alanyl-D-alanine ligase
VTVEGGRALLIDESYNANPASMGATLRSLSQEKVDGRRLAVLGTMLELGSHSDEAHAGLAPSILEAQLAELILVGEPTRPLAAALEGKLPVTVVPDAAAATDALLARLSAGDAVLVKASNGIGLASLVERVAGGLA